MKIRPQEQVAALDPTARRRYVDTLKDAYARGHLEPEVPESRLPRKLLEALFPEESWSLTLEPDALWRARHPA